MLNRIRSKIHRLTKPAELPDDPALRDKYHFVRDYARYVHELMAIHPLDKAMEIAVGGRYEEIGVIEKNVLRHVGLSDGMSLVDLGCGSGRLAHSLSQEMQIDYCGIDVVEALLDYARTKAPTHYRFLANWALTLPLEKASADIICAFSLLTHLHHAESYLYLEEMHRVLKPTGRVVFSFLEFAEPNHWPAFEGTVKGERLNASRHLNTFIERHAIELWAENLGFQCEAFIDSADAPYGGAALGQSIAILKPN
ncbi:MAG: methyltransferase domain-containing protein [Alphaproteobacteria bacterium]|nr:methyltransferase domain-containing protein [Alphaproteobacteria bacterium]